MLTPDITLIYILFISISLSAGIASIYFWVRVYYETKKGSIAWLLLALTAIFLISTSIFPSVAVSVPDTTVSETILIYLGFWSAVYTSIFAAAGFMMYTAFRTIPREKLGDFLLEGMVFQRGAVLKSACAKRCSVCGKHDTEECPGCIAKNRHAEEKCLIYECVVDKGITSCMDCDEMGTCDRYERETKKCPMSDSTGSFAGFEQTADLFKRSTLLEYTPHVRYEDAVIEICLRLYGEMVNTVLVSTQPRTSLYREKLADLIDVGAMKFIEISATVKTVSEDGGIIRLPVSELDKFFDLTSKLPKDCAILFEPLTHLIVSEGETRTYDFLSRVAERSSASELILIGFLNKPAHDEKVVSRFEGLFLNLADIIQSRIRIVKGGREEYVRFYAGERFYMDQNDQKEKADQ